MECYPFSSVIYFYIRLAIMDSHGISEINHKSISEKRRLKDKLSLVEEFFNISFDKKWFWVYRKEAPTKLD